MRILFLGDIVGKSGRTALTEYLPKLKQQLNPDFIIVNGENAAHGFGISRSIADIIFDTGVDCITLGNHAFDNADIYNWIDDEPRIVRPDNIASNAPGKGGVVVQSKNGHQVLVCNVLGKVFMDPTYDNPWTSIDRLIPLGNPISNGLDAVIMDFHAEATSEKQGVGWYLDGRASLVVGTHTHIPTGDTRILENGTAYQTDAGMCGSYNSILGMDKEISLKQMMGILPRQRHTPAEKDFTLSGVFVETYNDTGLVKSVQVVRIGANLQQTI